MSIHSDIIQDLLEVAQSLNPAFVAAFGPEHLPTWSEAGEWPEFSEEFAPPTGEPINQLATEYVAAPTVEVAVGAVMHALAENRNAAISMECGTGKSTSFVKQLYRSRLAPRIFVQQSSHVPAMRLAAYMLTKYPTMTILAPTDVMQVQHTRAVYYVGPGAMAKIILQGGVRPDDMILIDESQTTSVMHDINGHLFARMPNTLVSMTASVGVELVVPKGVVVHQVDELNSQVADKLAKHPDSSLIIGVTENLTSATPANAVVGLTTDVRVVYDTGLRLDPRVTSDGQIIHGERLALPLDFIQTAGRLGRLGKRGDYYYTRHASALPPIEGESYYDLIHEMFMLMLGGKGDWAHLSYARAIASWRSHCVKPIEAESVAGTSSEPSKTRVDDESADQNDTLSTVSSVTVDSDAECSKVHEPVVVADVPQGAVRENSSSRRTGTAVPLHLHVQDELGPLIQNLSLHNADIAGPAVTASRVRTQSNVDELPVIVRDKPQPGPRTRRVTQVGCRFDTWRQGRLFRNRDDISMLMTTRHPENMQRITLRGSQGRYIGWSPFVHSGDTGFKLKLYVTDVFRRMGEAVDFGRRVTVSPFPSIPECDAVDIEQARDVLAGDKMPTYSETEIMAVLIWFNRMVHIINHASGRLRPFVDYFRDCTIPVVGKSYPFSDELSLACSSTVVNRIDYGVGIPYDSTRTVRHT